MYLPEKRMRRFRFIWLFLAGLILVFFAEYLGLYQGLNHYFFDLFFRMRGSLPTGQEVVIIAIDERSLSTLGRWPINRSYYVKMLKNLSLAEAVGMDIILDEPSEEDGALAEAIEAYGKVVLPVYIEPSGEISFPVKAFSAASLGHVHLEQGIDGIVRGLFQRITVKGVTLPSFASAVYNLVVHPREQEDVLRNRRTTESTEGRIVQSEPIVINYYGPRGTFPWISLSEVIEGKWPTSFFKDKIALVGLTAAGIEDSALTPFTEDRNRMPGVEVHANILKDLIDHSEIRTLHPIIRWFSLLLLSVLGLIFFIRINPSRSALLWAGGILGVTLISFLSFWGIRLWVPPVSFYFALSVAYGTAYLFHLDRMNDLLRKANEDWEDSFSTIDDPITIHDERGRILRANLAAEKVFGTPLLQLLEQRCKDVAQSRPEGEDLPNSTGVPLVGSLIENLYVPELDRHFEVKSIPRLGKNHRFEGVVQVASDITDRIKAKEIQESLQRQLIMAQKMEAIGTLAGGIAHDFNNILSAILGFSELAALSMTEAHPAHKHLGQVISAGERAKELVNQILTFSRERERDKKTVQLASLVKEALKLLRPALPSTIEIKVATLETGNVLADPIQLHQIIMNLCVNAFHAMRRKGGVLTVAVENIDLDPISESSGLPAGSYVRLKVEDSGEGMTPEILERIFEPYFTTKGKDVGTGLGLSVVRGIVKTLGGEVSVQSQPGKGSIFAVLIPRIRETTPRPDSGEKAVVPTGDESILLVDDEEPLAQMWKDMLEKLGYRVEARTASLEARELFSKDPDRFDLVITDMTMPHLTGMELARNLMKVRPDIPIILCTGFSELTDGKESQEMGIRAFLMKPVIMGEMARTVRKVLDDKRSPSQPQG
jgi:signal transduction histidine kinase/CHASE2 domain-containing sensor protein/CheY-like chemotaxis protein